MERLTVQSEILNEYRLKDNSVNGCQKAIDKLAEYEEAEEQGLLLRLPVAIGSEVWKIVKQRDNFSDEPYRIATCVNFRLDMLSEIGKTVFLTKEEAEQALAEKKGV